MLATARRLDRLEELAAELPPGRVQVLAGDLGDTGFREQLWQQALDLPGGLDLLINNAGAGHYAEFAEQDPHAIRQIIELNVMALLDLARRPHDICVRGTPARSSRSPPFWASSEFPIRQLCCEQARGERTGQEPEVRAAGNRGARLGGLSGSHREQFPALRSGQGAGREGCRRASPRPEWYRHPARTRWASDFSGPDLDSLGRLEGLGVVSPSRRLVRRAAGDPPRRFSPRSKPGKRSTRSQRQR